MTFTFDLQPALTDLTPIERAVIETLAYSDVFDYPLRIDELLQYLTISVSLEELASCIGHFDKIESQDGFYFLKGRSGNVRLRLHRERVAREAYRRALFYGRLLGKLPFIRMVALTGSLAVCNCDETGDYDYMLVAETGRVWLARAFALLLNRCAHLFGETLCPNLIVSEQALEWNLRNLYYAREISQMVLISGEAVYTRLRVANMWVKDYLPNCHNDLSGDALAEKNVPLLQRFVEFLFGNRIGDMLESWEMNRKIARFTRQQGYGTETNFNVDICQGNFDHHGLWVLTKYHERLNRLEGNS